MSRKSFTLIELLVVLSALIIVAGIVLVNVRSAKKKANDAKRISEMKQVISAQELYYTKYGKYFTTSTQDGIPQIEDFLPTLQDPRYPYHPNYKWLSNLDCEEKFCAFAVLEERGICDKKIFLVFEGGWKEMCNPTFDPNNVSGCNCSSF